MATTNPPGLQQSGQPKPNVAQPPAPKKRSSLRVLGIVLLGIAILMFFYAAIAYIAWQNGQDARIQEAQNELNREVITQLDLAQSELAQNQIKLAEHRLEWLQEQAPNQPAVIALQATVDAWQPPVTLVPTSVSAAAVSAPATPIPATIAPTPTIVMTNTPVPEDASERLPALQELLDDELWEDAIREITVFQLDQPAYERPSTDQMLFEAYIGAGIYLTNGEHVSRGISYFEQAMKLGALTEEATSQLYYSKLYMTALSYSGVRWQVTVPSLEELCSYVPSFHNSCDLLHEARMAYAEQLIQGGDFCTAQEQLEAALEYQPSQEANAQYYKAQTGCSSATPTPRPNGKWTPTPEPSQ